MKEFDPFDNVDVAGVSSPDTDPMLEAARSISLDTGTKLKLAAEAAPAVPPDRYAQARKLGQSRGLTAEAVLPDLDLLARDETLSTLAREQPGLAEFLAQPNMHAIASDDYQNLSSLDRALYLFQDVPRALGSELVRYPGMALQGVGELYALGERTIQRGVDAALGAVGLVDPLKGEVPWWLSPGQQAIRSGQGIQSQLADPIAVPEERSNVVTDVAGGVGQLGGMVIQSALAPQSMLPSLLGLGAQQQAGQAREAGTYGTQDADTAIATGAAITAVTERYGLEKLLERIPPKIRHKVGRWIADKAIAGAQEAAQEVVEGVGQNLTTQQLIDPEQEILGGLGQQAGTAFGAATIVRALLGIRGFPTSNPRTEGEDGAQGDAGGDTGQSGELSPEQLAQGARMLAETMPAAADAAKLVEVQTSVRASKTAERDPGEIARFVQGQLDRVPGAPTQVYLDAGRVMAYFQEQGEDGAARISEMTGDPGALQAAQLGTGDVVVPIGQFAVAMRDEVHGDALRDLARLAPDRLANADLEGMDLDQLAAMFAVDDVAAPDEALPDPEQQVADDILGQLVATRRYDPGAAEKMAASLARQYAVRAQRRGRGETALDILQQYPLRLLSEAPGDLQGRAAPFDVALDPYIDDVLQNGLDAPVRSRTTGKSLVQAVIEMGGIDPDSVGGGDLISLDANLRPGLVVRGGLTAEAMGEALAQQDSGFSDLFTTKDEFGRPAVNEFLSMLTDELGGGRVTRVVDESGNAYDANRAEVAGAMRAIGQRGVNLESLSRPELRRLVEAELSEAQGSFYQPAYHGTHARGIDRFTLQKIGTGEGAQAYGWGLYFASSRSIAEWYRRSVAERRGSQPAFSYLTDDGVRAEASQDDLLLWLYDEFHGGVFDDDVVDRMVRGAVRLVQGGEQVTPFALYQALPSGSDPEALTMASAMAEFLGRADVRYVPPGQLYEVEVPDDGDLLDYDVAYSDQPPKVRAALKRAYVARGMPLDEEGEPLYFQRDPIGADLYAALGGVAGAQTASHALFEAGIPGLRYLDAVSRGATGGSHNYVIWDEDAISEPAPVYYQTALPEPATLEEALARIAELETELRTDGLTGMRNWRAFTEDEALGWSEVASFDLDGLKRVNDTFGHDAGDEMLRQAAAVFLAAEADGVRLYRKGGDEFALRAQDPEAAAALAQEIVDRLESVDVVFTHGGESYLYQGIGAGYGIAQTFEEADARLNADKRRRADAGVRQTGAGNGAPGRARRLSDRAAGVDGDRRGAQPGDAAQSQGRPVTETPEFRRWFGDSTVVDEQGAPRVMYHGTKSGGFDAFDPHRTSEGGQRSESLIWTASDPEFAGRWAGGRPGASVYPLYVKAERPFDPNDAASQDLLRSAIEAGVKDGRVESRMLNVAGWASSWAFYEHPQIFPLLRDLGFDSLISQEGGGTNIAVFSPQQVKSATANRGTFDPSNPSILFQNQAGPFYSALLRSVEEAKGSPKRGTVEQWKQWLDGAQRRGEFKQAERDWLGIDAWLDEVAAAEEGSPGAQVYPDGQVLREQIREFVRANELTIEESLLGPQAGEAAEAFNPAFLDDQLFRAQQTSDGKWHVVGGDGPTGWAFDTESEAERFAWDHSQAFLRPLGVTLPTLSEDVMLDRVDAADIEEFGLDDDMLGTRALFDRATDGGKGEFYGLVPGNPASFGRAVLAAIEMLEDMEMPQLVLSRGSTGGGSEQRAAQYSSMVAPGASSNYRVLLLKMPQVDGEQAFADGHFDPNTVAHVRFDERVGANGERVLFIDELQSDWHQQGRRKGYQGRTAAAYPSMDEMRADVGWEVRGVTDDDLSRYGMRGADPSDYVHVTYGDGSASIYGKGETGIDSAIRSEWRNNRLSRFYNGQGDMPDAEWQELSELVRLLSIDDASGQAVPDAPFKTTWPELVMKRMVRWAAENGFDRVAWPSESMVPEIEQWGTTAAEIRESPAMSKKFGAILDRYAKDMPRVAKALGKRFGAGVVPVSLDLGGQSEAIEDAPALSPVPQPTQAGVPDGEQFDDGTVLETAPLLVTVNGNQKGVVFTVTAEGVRVNGDGVDAIAHWGDLLLEDDAPVESQEAAAAFRVAWAAPVDVEMASIPSLWEEHLFESAGGGYLRILAPQEPVQSLEINDALREAAMAGQALFQEGDQHRGSIEFADAEAIIRLTEKANLSTVHHEFGHLFLNGLMEDAFLEGADPKLAADMDAFLAWRGKSVRVADGPSAVRAAIERADHEAFAEGYETYLFEGNAPSSALADLFATFRSWMIAVYGALRAKRVPISDEMRGVYDRLLATDAEIAEAEGAAGMEGLPSGLSSLVSPARWRAYTDQLQAARDGARAAAQAKVLQAHRREAEAWWKAELERTREAVRGEAERDRAQIALSLLSRGVMPDGQDPGVEFDRLSGEALKDEFGAEAVKRLKAKRVYRAKGGMAPDLAAEMLGFRNAAELFEALVNVVPLEQFVAQEADARMRAKYTDPRTDGSLPAAALEAVHGDKRLDALDAELALVAELAGQPAPPAKALGALARRMVNGKPLRQVRPNDYLVAERKAAREAMAALSLARPRVAEALMAKRRQVMNAHLYRAALEAKETERKSTAYLMKFTKPTARARLGKVGGDYLEQIDSLLGQISLRPASAPEIGRRAAMLAFAKAQEAAGQTITIPASLLALAETTNVRDLSVEALRGVEDTVRQIDHLARTKGSLLLLKERRDAAEVDEAMAESVREAFSAQADRTGDHDRWEKLSAHIDAIDLMRLQPSNLARDLDGKAEVGSVWQNTVGVIRDAVYGRMNPRLHAMRETVSGIYEKHYSKADMRSLDQRVYREVVGDSWSKQRILSLALNWGNVDNQDRVLNSARGRLTREQVGLLLGTLDQRDWAFVQDIAAHVNSYWPEIRDTWRRRAGIAPEKVEGTPFVVTTADGTQLSLPGWYFPIKYDGLRTGIKATKDEADDYFEGITTSRMIRAQTRHGHTEARVGGGGRTVLLDLSVVESHLRDVIRDLELGDAVNYVHRALNGPGFRRALNASGKTTHHEALETWLRDVATGEMALSAGYEKLLQAIRRNLSAAVLTFKVSTGLLQLTGLVQSTAEMGPRAVLDGVRRFKSMPWWGPNSVWAYVDRASPFMEGRNGKVTDGVQRVANAKAGKLKATYAAAERLGWAMIARNQRVADVITWLGAERKGMRDFDGDVVKARAYADDVVNRAQSASDWIDKPSIIRGNLGRNVRQSEVVRSLVPFMSYMLAKGAIARDKYQNTSFRSPASTLKFGASMVFLFAVESMIMDLVRGGLPDDDDDDPNDLGYGTSVDDWAFYLVGETVGGSLGTIPVFSSLFTEGRGYTAQSPYERAADILARSGDQGGRIFTDADGDGEIDGVSRAGSKALVDLMGVAFGVPSSQINVALDAVWDAGEGENVPLIDFIIKPDPNKKREE